MRKRWRREGKRWRDWRRIKRRGKEESVEEIEWKEEKEKENVEEIEEEKKIGKSWRDRGRKKAEERNKKDENKIKIMWKANGKY